VSCPQAYPSNPLAAVVQDICPRFSDMHTVSFTEQATDPRLASNIIHTRAPPAAPGPLLAHNILLPHLRATIGLEILIVLLVVVELLARVLGRLGEVDRLAARASAGAQDVGRVDFV
jgi:hypothetical protein